MGNEQPRKPIHDITTPRNELVRRTNPPATRSEVASPLRPQGAVPRRIEDNPFFTKQNNDYGTTKHARSKWWMWILFPVIIAGLLFGISTYFASADVEITPLSRAVKLEHEFTATADPNSGELPFQFMVLTEEETTTIPATIEKKVEKKASGKVLIYNSYGPTSQRLIKNTRLESPDRKIFRIDESVVVPGAKIDRGGKVTQPGVVEAIVYADAPGVEYNIGLSDFTIPGFKGDPRYGKFTARSKPDSPLAGGFSGAIKAPSDAAVLAAQGALKEELKKAAVTKARGQIPPGALFFPGSMIMKFEQIPLSFSTEDTTAVSLRAVAAVFFFDGALLSQKILEKALPADQAKKLSLSNAPSITFSFLDPVDRLVLADVKRFKFKLTGQASFVGDIDVGVLPALLVGKTKQEAFSLIRSHNNAEKVSFVIWPLWEKVLPSEPAKISVTIVTP